MIVDRHDRQNKNKSDIKIKKTKADKHVPKNIWTLTVEFMHGDATEYTEEEYHCDDEQHLLKLAKWFYKLGKSKLHGHRFIDLVDEEMEEYGFETGDYPWDATDSNNAYASVESIKGTHWDKNGVEWSIDFEEV